MIPPQRSQHAPAFQLNVDKVDLSGLRGSNTLILNTNMPLTGRRGCVDDSRSLGAWEVTIEGLHLQSALSRIREVAQRFHPRGLRGRKHHPRTQEGPGDGFRKFRFRSRGSGRSGRRIRPGGRRLGFQATSAAIRMSAGDAQVGLGQRFKHEYGVEL